jgi:hypothetical protein
MKYLFIFIFFIFIIIFKFNAFEKFTNVNNTIDNYYNKMNNISVPITPLMYNTDQCCFGSGENLYKETGKPNFKYNIIKELDNDNNDNKCCNYSLSNIKNPYDFRIHRSNNSKGLYPNSVTFGSQ